MLTNLLHMHKVHKHTLYEIISLSLSLDSVWAVYILPEEVGSRIHVLGLHILTLKSCVFETQPGQLSIISVAAHRYLGQKQDKADRLPRQHGVHRDRAEV